MKKVAIITVNYNGCTDTLELLKSLKKLKTDNLEIKTVVVDNASSDDSVNRISKEFPDADIVQTGSNSGFTGGNNRGLEYAKAWGADYYLLINNDTLINSADLITELVKTAESNPKIGIVAPKIYFSPNYEFYKDRYSKDNLGKVLWYAGGSFDWDNVTSVHRGIDEVDSGRYDQTEEVGFVSGCCFLVKAEVIDKAGRFDDKLFAYFEDNDLLERVKQANYKLYYNGSVSIYHKVSQTAGVGSKLSDYFGTRNRLVFGMKYARLRTRFALLRQALRQLAFGRPLQRRGVLDFLLGITGPVADLIKTNPDPVYPLKLSVVVVNYNTSLLTKKLLQSLYANSLDGSAGKSEIILLDNGTLDPCAKFVRDFPGLRYLVNKENSGFSGGYNRTIRYSRGEYILMLNSDIEVMPNSLSELIRLSDQHKGEAVTGGKLYYPDMQDQNSCFYLPTIWGAVKEYFFRRKGAYFIYLPKADQPTRVEGFIMACFLIPQKVLNKVGLLDEGTFIFFEDIEYCRRLKKAGVPLIYCPSAKFIHHHGASHKQLKEGEAYKMLVKGSLHYHGRFYYSLLYGVMWLGQKFSKVSAAANN